jgi:trigger factor
MKKLLAFFLALSLFSVAALNGCSKTDDKTTDNSLIYENLDLSKYVKVGKYLGVEIPKTDEVTPEDIIVAIKDCLYDNEKYSLGKPVTDRAVEEDDYLTVDIVGTIDGVAFEGGSQKDYTIVTGINAFATWSKYLIGAKINQTAKVQFAVPDSENYGEVAGKKIIYSIKIKEIRPIIYSELTAEVIFDISGYSSYEELIAYLKNGMEENIREKKTNDVWDIVVKNSKIIAYPQKAIDRYTESYYKEKKGDAEQSSMSFEEYLKKTNKTREDFEEESKKYAQNCGAEELKCYYIAKQQNLTVSENEYKEGFQNTMRIISKTTHLRRSLKKSWAEKR